MLRYELRSFCAANRSEALTTRVSQTCPSALINSSSDIPTRISGPFLAFLSIWAEGLYVPFHHVRVHPLKCRALWMMGCFRAGQRTT